MDTFKVTEFRQKITSGSAVTKAKLPELNSGERPRGLNSLELLRRSRIEGRDAGPCCAARGVQQEGTRPPLCHSPLCQDKVVSAVAPVLHE